MRNYSYIFRCTVILYLLFYCINTSVGQSTWDGGAGTNNWADAANWNNDELPAPSNSVIIIGHDIEIPDNHIVAVKNIEMCCGAKLDIGLNSIVTAEYISLQSQNTVLTNNGILNTTGGYAFGVSVGGFTNLINNGILSIYNSGSDGGIRLFGSQVTNNATINITTTTSEGDGIHIINFVGNVSVVTNHGDINITGTHGDGISGNGIFHNYGTVDITNVLFWRDLLIDGEAGLDFHNYANAMFKGDGPMDPTAFHWDGGTTTMEDENNEPGLLEYYCLSNCDGEDFTNSILNFHINGTSGPGQADGFDQVKLNKTATLGGTFNIIFDSQYIPMAGDTFVIMTYLAKNGDTPIINLPPLTSGLAWNTSIGANEIVLSVSSFLPVEMISFEAKNMEEYIELNWSTGSETNNRGFFVEKSSDGLYWEYLGFVEGNGNRHFISNYVYKDHSPHNGKNYYRLIQSDYDGRQEKSSTVSVNFKSGNWEDEINLYPNPIRKGDYLNVSFLGNNIDFDKISIYNQIGQLIYYQEEISKDIQINTSDFARGTHIMMMESRGVLVQKRFMVFE